MLSYLIGALTLALLCGGWAVIQRWIHHRDPDVRGPESSCGGCGSCGGGSCQSQPPKLPRARAGRTGSASDR